MGSDHQVLPIRGTFFIEAQSDRPLLTRKMRAARCGVIFASIKATSGMYAKCYPSVVFSCQRHICTNLAIDLFSCDVISAPLRALNSLFLSSPSPSPFSPHRHHVTSSGPLLKKLIKICLISKNALLL